MKKLKKIVKLFLWGIGNLKETFLGIENTMYSKKGFKYVAAWGYKDSTGNNKSYSEHNRLRTYFENNTEGNGIWKFIHYFDIYHRHFSKYIGKEVHIAEVGIYSGGSLNMWKNYFGDKCKVYGIDIQEDCMKYESDDVKIFIGDQESPEFWKSFRQKVPRVDILIDDGGHLVSQQIVTLEEMLPHLSPGGVYLCEDVAGNRFKFTAYINGLQNQLNNITKIPDSVQKSKTTAFQQQVSSIHQYPYVFVIEKQEQLVNELMAPKHGTVWGPFFTAVEK